MKPSESPLPLEIDVHAAQALLQRSHPALLLDCRRPDEHVYASIPGAILIPMDELPQRLAELAPWRDAPVVVHCHHGGRSLRVAHWLRAQGFAGAQSMAGGIDAWALHIDRQLARY